LGIRDLTRDDLSILGEPRVKTPVVKRFRDSHHRIARMFAAGLRLNEVHARSGYSYVRIQSLHTDPAFQELIASYREKVVESYIETIDEYHETLVSNMLKVERMVADKLDEAIDNGETLPVRDLISIGRDAADRVGYGKKETRTNINIDMGKDIEAALRRSAKARDLTLVPNRASQVPQQLAHRAESPLPNPRTAEAQPARLIRRA
jgi:hypothetical protein